MDPYYSEQRLKEEVLYLHSLWHQSFKRSLNPNPNPNLNPFKKMKFDTSGPPWPSPPPAPTPPSWPLPRPAAAAAAVAQPPEPPANNFLKLQQRATNDFRELFVDPSSDDDDDDGDEEERLSGIGDEKFRFFMKIFVEEDELRRYFEERRDSGEFFCFVCGGTGGRGSGKRFKTCHGLVQHASSLSKTEASMSHWAFGKVVCRVLGWDFDKIPVVVSCGVPLGKTLGDGNPCGGDKQFDNLQVGSIVMDNVAPAKNDGGETVEKEGVDKLQTVDGKFTKGEDECGEEDDSEDGDDDGSDDEEGHSEGDEEEGPNEDEEEHPSENAGEDDASDDEEEPSEDGNENDRKDETSDNLTASLAQLGNSQGFEQPLVSPLEWLSVEAGTTPSAVIGWPTLTPKLVSAASSLSLEEQATFAADQLQHKAVKLCKAFFMANSTLDACEFDNSDDEEEEDSSDDNESEHENSETSADSKELSFFLKLFSEDAKLSEFYINKCERWDFCCLVCGGIGKKVWKRYTGCVALVQHSNAVSKTRKKRAHRAYGQAICQVLGWDLNRFPSIALKGEPALPELCESQLNIAG